jgi:hypothetical protein
VGAVGVLAAGGGTTYYGNSYKALKTATGKVANGTITITVPVSTVGSPKAGSKIYSVGSYTMVGPHDDTVVLNTLPITVDSTPTFDTALPKAGAKVTVGGPTATRGLTGSSGTVTGTVPATKPGTGATTPAAKPSAAGETPKVVATERRSYARGAGAAVAVLLVAAGAVVYYTRRRPAA